MKTVRADGMVDYTPPYEKGEILTFPDNDNEWELVNIGDTTEVEAAVGFGLGGSTVKIPRFTQFRQRFDNLDKSQYTEDELKQKLSNRGYLHIVQSGGHNIVEWAPEKDWIDPRG